MQLHLCLRAIKENVLPRQPFQRGTRGDLEIQSLVRPDLRTAIPLRRPAGRQTDARPCRQSRRNGESVPARNSTRGMQHRHMANARAFRIKRLLNLQRSAMRFGSKQRSIFAVGKG